MGMFKILDAYNKMTDIEKALFIERAQDMGMCASDNPSDEEIFRLFEIFKPEIFIDALHVTLEIDEAKTNKYFRQCLKNAISSSFNIDYFADLEGNEIRREILDYDLAVEKITKLYSKYTY